MSDDLVYAVNPQGETVQIPRAQVAGAKAQGYIAASPEQISTFDKARQFGEGFGNEAKAFGAGAARGATFGLSDKALTATGAVAPETLAGLQEYNPAASATGEVAGVVGSALLIPGGGAVGAVGKAGAAAERVAAGLLPKGAGLASRLVAKAGARAAGSAVEGAVYGLGHVVSEEALGDPNLTAQKVAQEVGLSALFGGGLGALTGAAEVGVPALVEGARGAAKKVDEMAKGLLAKSPEGAKLVENIGELASLGPEAQAATAEKLAGALTEQQAKVREVASSFNKEMRPLETEQFLTEVKPEQAQEALVGAQSRLKDLAQKMRAEPEIYLPQYARQVERMAARIEKAGTEDALAGYKALNKVNQDAFTLLEKARKDTSSLVADSREAIDGLHKDIKGVLEDASVWGEAGARHAQINGTISDLIPAEKEFKKLFGVKVGKEWRVDEGKVANFVKGIDQPNKARHLAAFQDYQQKLAAFHDQVGQTAANAGTASFDRGAVDQLVNRSSEAVAQAQKQAHLAELMGGAPHPGADLLGHVPVIGGALKGLAQVATVPGQVKTLATIERLAQAVDKHIDGAVSTLIRGGVKASKVGRGEAAAGLASVFGRGPDAQERAFKSRVDEVAKLNDPEALVDKLASATGHIQNHAPMTAAGLQATGARAAQFLSSKVPQNKMPGIIPQEWKPTPAEIAKFNRYYEAVKAPASILKQAAAGTLTPEAVEAVKTVYPDLYQHMQSKIVEQLAGGKVPPYQSRMALSMLLGQDVDGSTGPHMIQANTAIYVGKGGAKQMGIPAPKPMGVGAAKGLAPHAGRMLTAQQKSAQR